MVVVIKQCQSSYGKMAYTSVWGLCTLLRQDSCSPPHYARGQRFISRPWDRQNSHLQPSRHKSHPRTRTCVPKTRPEPTHRFLLPLVSIMRPPYHCVTAMPARTCLDWLRLITRRNVWTSDFPGCTYMHWRLQRWIRPCSPPSPQQGLRCSTDQYQQRFGKKVSNLRNRFTTGMSAAVFGCYFIYRNFWMQFPDT